MVGKLRQATLWESMYIRGMQRMDCGPKVALQLNFCGLWKGPDFKHSMALETILHFLFLPRICDVNVFEHFCLIT